MACKYLVISIGVGRCRNVFFFFFDGKLGLLKVALLQLSSKGINLPQRPVDGVVALPIGLKMTDRRATSQCGMVRTESV